MTKTEILLKIETVRAVGTELVTGADKEMVTLTETWTETEAVTAIWTGTEIHRWKNRQA